MDVSEFPVFKLLNATQLRNFLAACREVTFAPGETFISQGSSGSCLYFVLEGTTRVFLTDDLGDERDLVTVSAPAVLGEMEALTGERRAASVQATEPVRALALDHSVFQDRVDDGDPATLKVVYQIARVLARRLAVMDQKLGELEDVPGPLAIGDLRAFQRKLVDEWTF